MVKNREVICAKFSNSDRFCSQNLLNNVCKLLQLLGDFVPADVLTGLRHGTPLGDFRPHAPWAVAPWAVAPE